MTRYRNSDALLQLAIEQSHAFQPALFNAYPGVQLPASGA
jgi:hypothetical protein